MTQTAMVRGLAQWVGKNMAKKFSEGGVTRIGFDAFTKIANVNPPLAVQMALVKYPALAPIVATVKDAATFETTWKALTDSVDENGCMTFDVKEMFGPVRVFRIGKADLDAIRGEMERAYKEEAAAAQAVLAQGQQAGGEAK